MAPTARPAKTTARPRPKPPPPPATPTSRSCWRGIEPQRHKGTKKHELGREAHCHPERSEGSSLRFAQDDTMNPCASLSLWLTALSAVPEGSHFGYPACYSLRQ